VYHDVRARPYAFDRVFARTLADTQTHPQDLDLTVAALQAELLQAAEDQATIVGQARADGFAAGLAQARTECTQALLTTEAAIVAGLAQLAAQFAETEARMAAVASDVALAAGQVLAATCFTADPTGAIDKAIGRVLTQTGYREALHIHVAPPQFASVEALVAARAASEQRRLDATVHADATVPPGDVRIVWDRGGLSLDAEARLAAVQSALAAA
jgi:flagellar assembly protein FliH